MSLFDKLFGRAPAPKQPLTQFQTLTAYQPMFTTWDGGIYESELVRSAIDARARNISKLQIEILGAAKPALRNKLKHAPNTFQTWGQFLYRLSTILDMQNTAFIVPIFDQFGAVSGVYPILPSNCEFVENDGTIYLRYQFSNGKKAAIEFNLCGIMNRFQYRDDFLGSANSALVPTMELINIQNQGIKEGVKSAATYRFMAKMSNFAKPEDLKKERERFNEASFKEDGGGILLFPNTYSDIQQIESKPFVVDAGQMEQIRTNVYNYFGVNEDVLQNKAFGDAWSAFYEGAIEPFAIQFSEVMTRMLYTLRERSEGSKVVATANRLQYMSNADKLQVSSQMLDRGIFTINDVRDIWNMPHVDGGDVRIIRGEYYNADEKTETTETQTE